LQEVKGHTLWTFAARAAPTNQERPLSRIPTPASIDDAPPAARPQLEAVKKMLGSVPNLFRMVANSPAALEGYVGLLGALSKGSLPAATHERIALALAETNGCDYCLSAHAWLGQNVAKLDDAEMAANRRGASLDPRADAAVRFARQVVERRGHVNDAELRAVREAGYDDAQIIEIVQHVALNTWTNYVNSVAQTVVDFPVVSARKAA
jgi:uncharacterized peroxidase-related enzyme